jgi:hypothetical protein
MIGRPTRRRAMLLAGLSIGYLAHPFGCYAAGPGGAGPSTRPAGVAVVELFTSQGCSSCPPAEQVLADLTRAAARDGRPVFTLAFHVDYWNRLGWADRFSDPAFSKRQEAYAKSFRLDGIYTPQMIVNGRREFVGSDRDAADRAIADALAEAPPITLTATARGAAKDGYHVRATVTGAATNATANVVINIAVVEQGLSTEVKAGENAGRRIEEPSVVRWFRSVPAPDAGDVTIPPLPGVRSDHASVIVYAQREGNGTVIAAARAEPR